MIEEILKLDSDLFLYFNNLGNPYFDNFWMFLSKTEANVIVYLLVLIAYIYSINNKKRAKTLFRLIIAIAIPYLTFTLHLHPKIKIFIPCHQNL